ncbi:hypothetical protein [Parasporobacterium paucivorans]|uniref:Uncharacterized protein n=1 Tax=Parasporobacterium paucivorans DSM 15970 TaxID=1122934 RepID=A0A1M6EAL9_9FIRM|nr:hypothetical protein [Parasporobacterium paucivorans]SHI82522.1 hypothetical protein SAMN02745691_00909 [Parasporobacterium paucivorans DSM 15970]
MAKAGLLKHHAQLNDLLEDIRTTGTRPREVFFTFIPIYFTLYTLNEQFISFWVLFYC